MKRLAIALLALSLGCFTKVEAQQDKPAKGELVWLTDATKAGELSAKLKKPIFAMFTGSDWCVWCHKLQHDVFDKPEFKAWAAKNVVLLELDFPRKKQLPQELMQQNNALQQAFKVQGYPTIWMFYLTKDETTHKQNISALGSLGYPEGAEPGKEQVKFLAEADRILATDTNRSKTKEKTKVKTKKLAKA